MAFYGRGICQACRDGNCAGCLDILRILAGKSPHCKCKRPGHDGEPASKQILDPESGTVYAPGLNVTKDGCVHYE